VPRIRSRDLEPKSQQGARAARAGLDFERALEGMHNVYALTGQATVERMNLPTAPGGVPNYPHLRRVTGGSKVDFWGVVGLVTGFEALAGRAVIIESKSNKEPAASLPISEKRGLHAEQLGYLVRLWEDFRACAIVLWRNGGQVGFVAGPKLGLVQGRNIPEARFSWIEGEDWLIPVLRQYREDLASRR